MKKAIALVFLILFSASSYANHLLNAEITWQCTSNGQYVFYLDLYRECTLSSGPSNSLLIVGPNGNIWVTVFDTTDVTIDCNGPAGGGCDSSSLMGRVVLFHYKSAPVTLTGSPPATGWEFTFGLCCAPWGNINLAGGARLSSWARSIMYPQPGSTCNSSPRFVANPVQQLTCFNSSLSCMALSDVPGDSLYYDFYLDPSWIPPTYGTGYAYNNPLPSHYSDTRNGFMHLNKNTGLFAVNAYYGISGRYFYNIKVDQWRNKQLISSVIRPAYFYGDFNDSINEAPELSVDTTVYNLERKGRTYRVDVLLGDTLEFEIVARDSAFNSGSQQAQMIQFDAFGYALDNTWSANNKGDNQFNSKATVTPVSPQLSYTDSLENRIRFRWVIDSEHFQGNNPIYYFQFKASDDQCPYAGVSNISLIVTIKPDPTIAPDSLKLCKGDSVKLSSKSASGQYSWFPPMGLSSDSVSNPMASPTSSQYYYINDPAFPGLKDSVYVEVISPDTFSFEAKGSYLVVVDSNNTNAKTWYYNEIPFTHPSDSLIPFGLGTYHVEGGGGDCKRASDSITKGSGPFLSTTSLSNGFSPSTGFVITGSQGFAFEVDKTLRVSYLSLPGLKDIVGGSGNYNFSFKVFDSTGVEIFSKAILLTPPISDVLITSTHFTLDPSHLYTFSLTGGSGYSMRLYQLNQLPDTPHNVGLSIKAMLQSPNPAVLPANFSPYVPPVSFGVNQVLSLDNEVKSPWEVYPNPAQNELHISGLSSPGVLELMDAQGKIIRAYQLLADQTGLTIARENLATGVYLIRLSSGQSRSVKKVIFE